MKIKLSESSKQMIQNAIHPSEVAKAILEAVTSDKPDFRYVVGQDASKIIEARKNMSDVEFRDLIKKQIGIDKSVYLFTTMKHISMCVFFSLFFASAIQKNLQILERQPYVPLLV